MSEALYVNQIQQLNSDKAMRFLKPLFRKCPEPSSTLHNEEILKRLLELKLEGD